MKKLTLIKNILDITRWVAVPWLAYLLFTYCGWLTAYSVAGFGFYMLSLEAEVKKDAALALVCGPFAWLCFTVQVWLVVKILEVRGRESVGDPS